MWSLSDSYDTNRTLWSITEHDQSDYVTIESVHDKTPFDSLDTYSGSSMSEVVKAQFNGTDVEMLANKIEEYLPEYEDSLQQQLELIKSGR